jgi:tetratricopeptide (TPR) repeat protein
MITVRGDRGVLPDFQADLAATLADVGKIDEAERLAMEARANASPSDRSCTVAATTALAAVRAAQGRDAEAEELLRSALALAEETEFKVLEIEPLQRFTRFLRERGRTDEAAVYAGRFAELAPLTSTERIV